MKIPSIIKPVIAFVVIFSISIIPLLFLSPWISGHFYVWVDNLSESRMEVINEFLINNYKTELSKNMLNNIFSNKDDVYIKISDGEKVIYDKNFDGKYINIPKGFCVEDISGSISVMNCRPAHRGPIQSLHRYLVCLFNLEVITKYKYTDYLLLHASIICFFYSLFFYMRITRKNALINEIIKSLSNISR